MMYAKTPDAGAKKAEMKATTISHLRAWKSEQRKFASLTAYDACFAGLFEEVGIKVMLVGDSLGMVLQGHDSTLPVTVDTIAYHTRCVRQGAPHCFLLADMPFMSYATPEQACDNAAPLMRAGANMLKIEGGAWLEQTVRVLTERAVPVCAHLGLTPQSVNIFGGFKVQGRDAAVADALVETALLLEKAGAQMVLLECVPAELAQRVTQAVGVPVIGIGAGNATDGQILVMHDMLGIHTVDRRLPKFVKVFTAETVGLREALHLYIKEVEEGTFPAAQHSF
jgi:3-methyl-2-oxobutanoate hydroxymethyltransferase